MRFLLKFLTGLGLFVAASVGPASAGDGCPVFGVMAGEKFLPVITQASRVMSQAGICHRVKRLPLNRLTRASFSGEVDGELLRIDRYEEVIGHIMTRVPEPVFRLTGLLVTRDAALQTVDDVPSDRLGVSQGVHWSNKLTAHIDDKFIAPAGETLLRMLKAGRLDGILLNDLHWQDVADDPGFQSFSVRVVVRLPFHTYVSKEYAHLVPRIDAALKRFKASGGTIALN